MQRDSDSPKTDEKKGEEGAFACKIRAVKSLKLDKFGRLLHEIAKYLILKLANHLFILEVLALIEPAGHNHFMGQCKTRTA